MTIREIAEALELTERQVRYAIQQNEIEPAVKAGQMRLFAPSVLKLIESARRGAA